MSDCLLHAVYVEGPTFALKPSSHTLMEARDQQAAVGAMQALNGLVFDLEKQSTLYISLAKSNSKSKRSRTGENLHLSVSF
ncbi:hypothetical protein FRX31_032742 [Thalictrum thalictroides]|uniref:Uncharacterized protein n=1 Tax=Thalictrum thalictroides TaxID=46969 RepID=A0A7J6UZS7_THATH|nr:hypothetical protein FRX31_032742 [Thalictrum thalictroides]